MTAHTCNSTVGVNQVADTQAARIYASFVDMKTRHFLFWLTIIGVAATVLQWAEQSRWLPQWLSFVATADLLDALIKLVVFAVLILGAIRLGRLERKMASVQVGAQRQNDFLVGARLDDGRRIVELDNKQYELGPGAYEFYSECNSHQKAQIISAFRSRFWHTPSWSKDDFVLIVDEKEALRRGLAALIQKANEIEDEIRFTPRAPQPKESLLSILASAPPAWRHKLTDWQVESRKWLEKSIPHEAPAFNRPPQFTVTDDYFLDGLAELNDYRERLIRIQERI